MYVQMCKIDEQFLGFGGDVLMPLIKVMPFSMQDHRYRARVLEDDSVHVSEVLLSWQRTNLLFLHP